MEDTSPVFVGLCVSKAKFNLLYMINTPVFLTWGEFCSIQRINSQIELLTTFSLADGRKPFTPCLCYLRHSVLLAIHIPEIFVEVRLDPISVFCEIRD